MLAFCAVLVVWYHGKIISYYVWITIRYSIICWWGWAWKRWTVTEFGVGRYMILLYKSEVVNVALEKNSSWIGMRSPKMIFEKEGIILRLGYIDSIKSLTEVPLI